MLSLGALNDRKYCTFSCQFCYLQSSNFESYVSLSVPEIMDIVRAKTGTFDRIYISGDTDSFAPPRTDEAVWLVEELSSIDVDLLFTTRAILSPPQIDRIATASLALRDRGLLLVGCVSISQMSRPDLEPKPIPSPDERGELLRKLGSTSVIPVLAMRPFLPGVPVEDYLRILDRYGRYAELVLGSDWYADDEGVLEDLVDLDRDAVNDEWTVELDRMDFDANEEQWRVYRSKALVERVEKRCADLGLPFFMRSRPAMEYLRAIAGRSLQVHTVGEPASFIDNTLVTLKGDSRD